MPGSDDTAVIDLPGTYTVTLNDDDATVAGFTLNNADATFSASAQSLTINGPASFTAGVVSWTNSILTGSGSLLNDVTVSVLGNCSFSINSIVNNGTISLPGVHSLGVTGSGTTLTNLGSITLGSGSSLLVDCATFVNASKGVITNSGNSFAVRNNGTFQFDGGTLPPGSPAIYLQEANLIFGAGATGGGLIRAGGMNTLSGDIPSGITVQIGPGTVNNGNLVASGSLINSGVVALTSTFANAPIALTVSSGTLTNGTLGEINLNTGAAGGGARVIAAEFENVRELNVTSNSARLEKASVNHVNSGVINI